MKHLIIMGAGGCGREVYEWVKDINEIECRWDRFSFLDYDEHLLDEKGCDAQIIGNDENYVIREDDEFVCAIGSGSLRKKVIDKMEAKGAKFINIIHPTAVIGDSVKLMDAVILYPYCVLSADVVIGKGCIINMNSVVAHDVVMGEYCTLSNNCDIAGECMIGKDVFMGVGAHIIPRIKVEDHAFICAGSTVMTRVKNGAKMFGTPAKRLQG